MESAREHDSTHSHDANVLWLACLCASAIPETPLTGASARSVTGSFGQVVRCRNADGALPRFLPLVFCWAPDGQVRCTQSNYRSPDRPLKSKTVKDVQHPLRNIPNCFLQTPTACHALEHFPGGVGHDSLRRDGVLRPIVSAPQERPSPDKAFEQSATLACLCDVA